MPAAEVILWERIRRKQLAVSFRRQRPISPFIVDFACVPLKIIIELDGDSHIGAETYDAKRTLYLEEQGWTIIRFWNGEVYEELENCMEQVKRCIASKITVSP